MNFNFFMPVNILSGENCVLKNADLFAKLGKCCLIVTGKNSAKKCGALDDVTATLEKNHIRYEIFDKIQENPLISVCREGGMAAKRANADFIVGIGGGSPLDAAKAIAAFARNEAVTDEQLFTIPLNPPLPLVAIPTTAGTGSEANNYSILTLDGQNKKRTFKTEYSYARYAFLDAKYTLSLSEEYTKSTALDAFCHCIESFLSPKSTVMSELLCVYAAAQIWNNFPPKAKENREALLYASCAAGAAINATGTGFPHPLGYNLTLYKGIPHGRACGAFIGHFITYTQKSPAGKARLEEFSRRTNIPLADIQTIIPKLSDVSVTLAQNEIGLFIENVKTSANFANNPYVVSEDEIRAIYKEIGIR